MSNNGTALNYLKAREKRKILGKGYEILPKIYKSFASNFKLGRETDLFRTLKIQIDINDIPKKIRWENSKSNPWKVDDDRLLGMITTDELISEINEYHKKVTTWHNSGMIKIGWTHRDFVLLGIENDIKDKIFLYGESMDFSDLFEIAEDVFTLFSLFDLVPDIELINFYKIDLNNYNMHWGEDFWRIREDKEEE